MNREYVSSTNIASVGYDEPTQTLEVEFTNGSVYQYYNVDAGLYERFKEAPSKGQFLNTYIRSGYPFSRVG
ncbi:KTSC domain-containing protein [Hyphomicrobium facile]|uniref:KTSC domain-containing protein n=1 Tax=Hyphomicrobium facile TaxID=51670 RepID=A0A1I7NEA2_9HYPH|nr:KTSC domain-containing protein [Hyphomicrobium facile]SFV32876.1 KTSC domain-containing protein [Hyphomicrobium facile]